MSLGTPHVHLRVTDSTNERARELAERGAPHGTLVTAAEQTAGRGRQGRAWSAPRGRALLCSLVLREVPRLLPLAGGVAVAEVVEEAATGELAGAGASPFGDGMRRQMATVRGAARARALLKWPNDVLLGGRKVAGILIEGRPQEGWAVLGIGINVAVRPEDFPPELRHRAGTLGLEPDAIEPTLAHLLDRLQHWVTAAPDSVLKAVRGRDALLDEPLRWAGGHGRGAGIDDDGRLIVATDGGRVELDAGEVHLERELC